MINPSLMLMWYDDSRRPLAEKIAEAAEAYAARWGVPPTLALISVDETETPVASIAVQRVATVRRNNVWVGRQG